MADTFFNPISLPDVPATVNITTASIGYLKLYAKEGILYQKDSQGIERPITNIEGTATTALFIQDTQPEFDGKYLWIQTNYQTATGFTFWFEDGIAP